MVLKVESALRHLAQPRRRHATETPLAKQVSFLADVLGDRLAAVVLGTDDGQRLADWTSGGEVPDTASQRRIARVYTIVSTVQQAGDNETTRGWFLGANSDLDDRIPAVVIRDDLDAVFRAARRFVAHD